jgi:RHS repeat-associated protein
MKQAGGSGYNCLTLCVACAGALHTGCSSDVAGPSELLGTAAEAVLVNTTVNQVGRLTSSGAGALRSYTQYDALGRATAVQHALDQTSYVYKTIYGYPQTALSLCTGNACGAAGAPGIVTVASTFPDGETVAYTYDATGGQQSVTTTACADNPRHTNGTCTSSSMTSTIVDSVLRNVRGQTVRLALGDGSEQDHCYNDGVACAGEATPPNTDMRLNRIKSLLTATPSTVIQNYTYVFDVNANVTSITDNLTGTLTAAYTYDSLNEVASMVSNGATSTYGYDTIGNLISKEGLAQTYGGAGRGPHAVATAASLSYAYDANGNLSSRTDGLAIVWDATNMPVQMAGGAATSTTKKFFLGESLWKKIQGTTTTFYLPSMRIESGAAQPHKYFADFAERDVDGSLKFYHSDHLGSSTLVTNASGTVIHRAAYMPYGGDRSVVNYTPAYTESFTPKYQFNFKEKEQDGTGFYDYGARVFNPATGRWLSADSNIADGSNRYAYVLNNPLGYNDPTGHQASDLALKLTSPESIALQRQIEAEDRAVRARFDAGFSGWLEYETYKWIAGPPLAFYHTAYWAACSGCVPPPSKYEVIDLALGYALEAGGTVLHTHMSTRAPGRSTHAPSMGDNAASAVGCFDAATVVLTPDGERPISEVAVGDAVWSVDLATERWDWHQVAAIHVHEHSGRMVVLRTEDETIRVTPNHPICVREGKDAAQRPRPLDIGRDDLQCSSNGRWVEAGDLIVNDRIVGGSRDSVALNLETVDESRLVFNLEVPGAHTYTVGRAHLLVHNKAMRITPIVKVDGGAVSIRIPGAGASVELARTGGTIRIGGIKRGSLAPGSGAKLLAEALRRTKVKSGDMIEGTLINTVEYESGIAAERSNLAKVRAEALDKLGLEVERVYYRRGRAKNGSLTVDLVTIVK